MYAGFNILSAATTITGNGVLIYDTDALAFRLPRQLWVVNIGGNANVTLTAMTTGTWAGILIMKDRRFFRQSSSDSLAGTSLNLTGTIYLPARTLQGGSGFTVGSNVPAIIADTISVGGGSFVVQSGTGSGQYKFAALVQ